MSASLRGIDPAWGMSVVWSLPEGLVASGSPVCLSAKVIANKISDMASASRVVGLIDSIFVQHRFLAPLSQLVKMSVLVNRVSSCGGPYNKSPTARGMNRGPWLWKLQTPKKYP